MNAKKVALFGAGIVLLLGVTLGLYYYKKKMSEKQPDAAPTVLVPETPNPPQLNEEKSNPSA